MKKNLFAVLGVVASLMMATTLSAQVSEPTSFTSINDLGFTQGGNTGLRALDRPNLRTLDYTTKDIYGEEHKTGDILRSGRFLIVDLSAVWCGPCWTLHSNGTLDKIYEKYGPKGTNQLGLFWVDCEGKGKGAVMGGSGSQGDWSVDKEGKKLPYPVISDKKFSSALGLAVTGSVPQLFILSGDGTYLDCTDAIWAVSKTGDYKPLEALFRKFMSKDDAPIDAEIKMPTNIYAGETVLARTFFRSVAQTTYQWTVKGGDVTVATPEADASKITFTKAGDYEVTFTVSNAKGKATATKTVSVKEGPVTTFPMFSGFDHGGLDADKYWRAIDLDGDGISFESFLDNGFYNRLHIDYSSDAKVGAEGSRDAIITYGSFYPNERTDNGRYKGWDLSNQENYLVSAPFTVAADAVKPILSFFHTKFFVVDINDEIEIYVTTSADLSAPASYTTKLVDPIVNKPNDWAQTIVDLSAYKGKTIRLAFKLRAKNAACLRLDQINVSMDGSLATDTPQAEAPQVSIVDGRVSVLGAYDDIKVYDMTGALVATDAQLAAGVYVVSLEANHQHYTHKVVVR